MTGPAPPAAGESGPRARSSPSGAPFRQIQSPGAGSGRVGGEGARDAQAAPQPSGVPTERSGGAQLLPPKGSRKAFPAGAPARAETGQPSSGGLPALPPAPTEGGLPAPFPPRPPAPRAPAPPPTSADQSEPPGETRAQRPGQSRGARPRRRWHQPIGKGSPPLPGSGGRVGAGPAATWSTLRCSSRKRPWRILLAWSPRFTLRAEWPGPSGSEAAPAQRVEKAFYSISP